MTDDNRLVYRIGMVGPSRVGKTSLITALLRGGQQLLEGTSVTMKADGSATQKRLAQHRRELEGSLLAGAFKADALGGNQEKFLFHLLLDPGVAGAGIQLQLLDYPGNWFDPLKRPSGSEWEECERFLEASSVLVIPVDAAVLMEASTVAHRRAMPGILATDQVGDVVRAWLTERKRRPDEPGLLMLCPVKCESYFDDNGGDRDDAEELLTWVRRVYHDAIEAVPRIAPHVRTVYCPVDTIGCVEITGAEWQPEPDDPTGLSFHAEYGVRPPGRQSIMGADGVLTALCRLLVGARQQVEEAEAVQKEHAAEAAQRYAEQKEGFFRDIWYLINGERELRRQVHDERRADLAETLKRTTAMREVVDELASRRAGRRIREW